MERIKIEGYKSIKSLDLELRPINILIGANGSGKSNLLSFFDFLKQIYHQNLREYVALKGIDTFLHKGDKVTEEISARLFLEKEAILDGYSFTLKKGDTGLIFTKDEHWFDDLHVDYASFDNESSLDTYRIEIIPDSCNDFQKYHFHDTSENSPFNKESNIYNDMFYLYEKGSNLGSYLYHISQESKIAYNLIVKTIQSIAPYFLDFFLMPEKNGNIKLRWRSKYSSTIYGINSLSDGTIRFIALTTLFMQPRFRIIIIDEPELGLHPTAITKLAGMIKSAAAKGTQVILATQSTDLISHFEPEDIITVDQVNGESRFERLNSETLKVWLEDYTIDDLWKRSIISSGQPNFD